MEGYLESLTSTSSNGDNKEELQNSGLITTIELQQKLLYEAIVNDNI